MTLKKKVLTLKEIINSVDDLYQVSTFTVADQLHNNGITLKRMTGRVDFTLPSYYDVHEFIQLINASFSDEEGMIEEVEQIITFEYLVEELFNNGLWLKRADKNELYNIHQIGMDSI